MPILLTTVEPDTTVSADSPAPLGYNPLTVPCFVCGLDYLNRPGDISSGADPVEEFYPGCTCEPCADHWAQHAVDTDGPSPSATTPDTTDHIVVQRLRIDGGRTVALPTCRTHSAALTMSVQPSGNCAHCAAAVPAQPRSLSIYGDPIGGADEVIGALEDLYGTLPYISGIVRQSLTQPRRGDTFTYGNTCDGEVFGANNTLLCTPCADTAVICDQCSNYNLEGNIYTCPEDDALVCYNCQRRYHTECMRASDVHRARETFIPRNTIHGALQTAGRPGVVVQSTRAVGIEVETSRGVISRVANAENEALWPVIANIGTDGSVNGENPVEFRLLPQRGDRVEYAIDSIHTRCERAQYRPDTSAGVHMHVDASDLGASDVWRAFAALVALEPALFSLAAEHRANNTYCRAYGANAPTIISEALASAARGDYDFNPHGIGGGVTRYQAINAQSYEGHRTLEVRVFDTAHDADGRERYTLAAALITAAVDFAATDNGAVWLANAQGLGTAMGSIALIIALTEAGRLSAGTSQMLTGKVTSRALTGVA